MGQDLRKVARKAAVRNGLNPTLFERQIGQESGFRVGARSPAGAQGVAQIMPATARAWGVNPNDPVAALNAAAKHMAGYVKSYGSYRDALVAYNAGPGRVGKPLYTETRNYIQRITGGGKGQTRLARRGGEPGRGGGSDPGPAPARSVTTPGQPGQARSETQIALPGIDNSRERVGLVMDFLNGRSSTLDFATQLPGLADVEESATLVNAGFPGTRPVTTTSGGQPGGTGGGSPRGGGPRGGGGRGTFKITGPNPGRLTPGIKRYAEQVAGAFGGPLTGSDGTGHSKFTTSGNVSAHFSGNATDIPAAGSRLTRMGQAALIAAGMPKSQARKQKGGVFNIGGKQILFNTNTGGNHFDHLHIGLRSR